jgi:Tfp pilus assembly PilM family ATPase
MRSIGIDPGDQAVKVVELDGSYKKTRLLRVHLSPAAASSADPGTRADVVAAAAREAIDQGMRGEVCIGHPCREAVLRTIELPFKGHDAIRKVVKSEIEGEIQSQSVDDMVVDFHEIGPGASGGTRVLVASVPKAGLRTQLGALTANAIEPETIDLDTMALWRAAHWAGAFADADDDAATPDARSVTAVLDIGARSVKVLLVDGEHLIEMRALRLGDGVVAEELARRHGLDPITARETAHLVLRSGADQRVDVPVDAPVALAAPLADAEPAAAAVPAAMRAVRVAHAEVEASYTAYLQRLARELQRFLTASGRADQLRAVWVTGGASRAPGTHEMLASVFGAEVRELDVLGRLQHDLAPDQVEELGPRLATVVGLALGRFGGPDGFQLRQEDLIVTRGFERVKFPLAIACMVGLLALFVHWNKKQIELNLLELRIGRTYIDKNPKAPVQFYGMLYSVFSSGWFEKPDQFRLEQSKGKDYTHKDLLAELVATPVHRRLNVVHDRLKTVADQKQKDSGIYEDVSIESGLAVLVRWAELVKSVEAQLGRFLVTRISLDMKAGMLEVTIAFRGEDFRARQKVLTDAMEAELKRADSPFEAPEKVSARREVEPFKDSNETGVLGAYCTFTLHIRETFAPFGPSAGNAIGAAARPASAEPKKNEAANVESGR